MKKFIVILGILLACGAFAVAQDASVTSTDDLFAEVDGVALTDEEEVVVDGGRPL